MTRPRGRPPKKRNNVENEDVAANARSQSNVPSRDDTPIRQSNLLTPPITPPPIESIPTTPAAQSTNEPSGHTTSHRMQSHGRDYVKSVAGPMSWKIGRCVRDLVTSGTGRALGKLVGLAILQYTFVSLLEQCTGFHLFSNYANEGTLTHEVQAVLVIATLATEVTALYFTWRPEYLLCVFGVVFLVVWAVTNACNQLL
ncbi:MAG: hypothetical protein Q9218_002253 [Villophora microphyllina]